MKDLEKAHCDRAPKGRTWRRRTAVGLLGLLVSGGVCADDAYLRMLDEEVTKVESVPTDNGDIDGIDVAVAGGAPTSASREGFESLLREQHVGTYSFYRRLPERSRQEVFKDYSDGASMDVLRDKIVDRFLHP